jgi:type II secretory pathway pseudopilin PulG
MRFYLEYINHLGRLQKKSSHRRLQAGFTITEVLLAGLMMLIAVLVSGIGVINLLRSNYRGNADSEIQNNLNRTLEFVSDDVRRARIITETVASKDDGLPDGAQSVLSFQIPDPKAPSKALDQKILYYTKGPGDSLTGPRVLWRYGPDLDENGNYITPDDIKSWNNSPVTDMLAAAVKPVCENFKLIAASPSPSSVDGFYACVRDGGRQVILNANAQVKMTTNEEVNYSVSTRVFPRTTDDGKPFFLTPPFALSTGGGMSGASTLPIVTQPATVTAKVIGEPDCASDKCRIAVIPKSLANPDRAKWGEHMVGSAVEANPGDSIRILVYGMRNVYGPLSDTVTVYTYTSDSSTLPKNIESIMRDESFNSNQILFEFKNSSATYQVLVTITPD